MLKFDFFIQVHLTERCNLRCRHCYQENQKTELKFDDWENFFSYSKDLIREWEIKYDIEIPFLIKLTGGEPFLREDFFEIVKFLNEIDIEPYILTNGTLIDKKMLSDLKKFRFNGFQISIEGSKDTHDNIRGQGTFYKVKDAIKLLKEENFRVFLKTTLSRLNYKDLNDLIDISNKWGVDGLGFSRLVPIGNGSKLHDYMLSSSELKDFYLNLKAKNITSFELLIEDPLGVCVLDDELKDKINSIGGCSAGFSSITVLSDGEIVPCRRMPISLGNILKDDLRKIWSENEVLLSLRDKNKYKNGCSSCLYWNVCRGCRAIAYSLSKEKQSWLNKDPQCFLTESLIK
ncbi:Radical SAM domain protein [Thermodesulfobium narugense DSM 14796]|uniref:Radical SAM domain protein n=1 Tax=Thermodesulfobium narugense DSM 14796 TaxID=747365 RepID=M1E773_9BACT|nr:radical SAM protein [Thermodesulfobium narugense]AEE14523.1 Radical SAM domain protein [Thermodesulfobium narugense DSM 14796]